MAKIMQLMGMNTFKPKQTMFFANIVRKTIQQRKASKERKDDLIDLMLDAMEGLKDESQEENEDQYEADLQRRLQEEVDAAYEAAGGKTPDYNDIQGFTFL